MPWKWDATNTGTDTSVQKGPPPFAAYSVKATSLEAQQGTNGPRLQVQLVVTKGEHKGSEIRDWLHAPPADKLDGFLAKRCKRAVTAFIGEAKAAQYITKKGVPYAMEAIVKAGKEAVIYVDEEEITKGEKAGQKTSRVRWVLPEDAKAALAGRWTPDGGAEGASGGTNDDSLDDDDDLGGDDLSGDDDVAEEEFEDLDNL